MSRERSDSQRQLLEDILREEDGAKQAALAAFRRARFVRRLGRAGALVALAGAVIIGVVFSQRDSASHIQAVQQRDSAAGQREVATLTDEGLLASFPPNSCFLAEVDGRKVLVFVDPVVEKEVLHRGTLGQRHGTY